MAPSPYPSLACPTGGVLLSTHFLPDGGEWAGVTSKLYKDGDLVPDKYKTPSNYYR